MFKKLHVFRVKPGQELLGEIGSYCLKQGITSAVVLGIIGSVQRARLNYLQRLPGQYLSLNYSGPMEIICAQGSVALKDTEPILHIHAQLSRPDFAPGGHLAEAVVFSTAEVTLGELDFQLRRQLDTFTGLNELVERS